MTGRVVDMKEKIKSNAMEEADKFRKAFERDGERFLRNHFHMNTSEFMNYVRKYRKYPPVKSPFMPYGNDKIPQLTMKIWKEMEKSEAWREILDEDPFAFMIELGKRFNKRLEKEKVGSGISK